MADRWLPNPAPFPEAPPESWPGHIPTPAAEVPPPPPPPRSPGPPGPRRWLLPVALIALCALVSALAVVVFSDDDELERSADRSGASSTEPSGSPTSVPEPPTSAPGSIEAVLDDLIAFVERERGLQFEQRPRVRVVADEEFEQALAEQVASSEDLIRQDETLYRALGLIPADADLLETYQRLFADAVLGFYDPETDELLVRGEGAGPFVRQIVVHELTHALEDQRFDLDRQELDRAPDESAFGFAALVEGSAKRVENAYLASLSPSERAEAEQDALQFGLGLDPTDVSIPLVALTQAPYVYGELLVDELVDRGGQGELDGAFGAPPLTSEQVFEPDRYEQREPAVDVDPPSADGEVVDRGALGALVIDITVEGGTRSVLGRGLSDAATGWGGDAFVSWRDAEDRSCVRFRVVGDTPADTDELRQAFARWEVGPGAELGDAGDAIEVSVCR